MTQDRQISQHHSSSDKAPGDSGELGRPALLATIPPTGLLLLAILSIQIGAGLATQLFATLGADGTVALRIIFSAILLGLAARRRVRTFGRTFLSNWKLLLVFGLCIAAMNFFFYQAIARIPLGAAVALEFIGPLGVAVLASRRLIHFAWVSLAALGILLLSPFTGAELDSLGITFAFVAGAAWALFIILARRVGGRVSGNDGLAIGMIVAGISMIPFAMPVASHVISDPIILLGALGVALLSTTFPFTLEFEALKRISTRTYGVMVSVEPAVAAVVGTILLGERIGVQGMIAITCVVVAAIGIAVADEGTPPPDNR